MILKSDKRVKYLQAETCQLRNMKFKPGGIRKFSNFLRRIQEVLVKSLFKIKTYCK